MKSLIILCVLFAVASCMDIKFGSCAKDPNPTKITAVSIEPCTEEPCVLHRGATSTISIKFTPTADVDSLTTVVKGKIGPLWVPFPLDQPDACKGSVTCPLKAGQEYTYKFSLPVKTAYPQLSVVVSWELKDKNGKDVVCVMFPTKLE